MSKKTFSNSFSGKGYYIALILCAVAIGISGYLYYRNADNTDPQSGEQLQSSDATGDRGLEAVATQPGGTKPVETTRGEDTPTTPKTLVTASPLQGQTIAEFSVDALSYNQTTRDWRVHNGIDIAAESGTPVTAAADGQVYTVYNDETMGTTVVIRHEGGYTTVYASLAEEVSVAPGDTVELGDVIGAVGNTALLENAVGNHVHFSVTCNDEPMDPEEFLELG